MKNLIRTVFFAVIITSALVITASAANIGGGKVTASSLNFRAEPSTEAAILAEVTYGTQVVVSAEIDEEWYQVLYQGVRGYMHSNYIEVSDNIDFDIGKGEIVGDGVRFRTLPSYEGDTITYLYLGDEIKTLGVYGEWYKLERNGEIGFVHSDYVSVFDNLIEPGSSSPARIPLSSGSAPSNDYSETGNALVDFAMDFLGTVYVYGGSSPSGFDCSGFTYYVFNQNGYKITRTASSQWGDGEYISKDSLEMGDLVFFSSDYSDDIEHVGMYIGGGQFIHSSSGGGCVKINNMSDFYYNNNYYGARRVIG